MDRHEGVLKVQISYPKNKKKEGKKGAPAAAAPKACKKSYVFHYAKKNGAPGQLPITNFDLDAYEDGAPCVVYVEGPRIVRLEIGGQTLSSINPTVAKNQTSENADKDQSVLWGHAPYNFSSYVPDLIMPPFDDEERVWSGQISCELKALTPILVAQIHEKNDDGSTNCKFMEIDGKPVIPGSSIKGLLRAVVEILSYSGLRPMNKKKLFWRDVQDPNHYVILFDENPRGGFLRQHGADFEIIEVEVTREKPANPAQYLPIKTGNKVGKDKTPNIYYFRLPGKDDKSEPIDREVVNRLWDQLTDNQAARPHVKDRENLMKSKPGLPVFFRESENMEIVELGFCRYFRIQYRHSPYDLAWPDAEKRNVIDVAQTIFGYADKEIGARKQSLRGRVAADAFALEGEKYGLKEGIAAILGEPRPTCVPCYLEQDPKRVGTTLDKGKNYQKGMATYNDANARLRGRKLYWHSVEPQNLKPPASAEKAENTKILNHLFPLQRGARGAFTIHVAGLGDSELGCLFEALELKENCAHKLGMGKPLGFGSARIRIKEARLEKRALKYSSLTDRLEQSAPRNLGRAEREALREKFRDRVFNYAKRAGAAGSAQNFYELPPIRQLLKILDWTKQAEKEDLAYMTLKEYQAKMLLPHPNQIETFPPNNV